MKVVLIIIAVYVIFYILQLAIRPIDSTDFGKFNRSGVSLIIDAKTGCHYLARFGVMTPRLDKDGNQICTGKEE
jgi:hypothetical protein